MAGKGLTYGQFVGATMDCPRADFRDCIIGGALTALHDVVAPRLSELPGDISAQLRRDFWKRHADTSDWAGKLDAQAWLQAEVETFEAEKLHIAFDEHEIRARAARWSALCGKMMCLEVMQDFARSVGVEAPQVGERISRSGAAKRLQCERWWRRAMRRTYTRRAESHLRSAGFVHRHRQVYASDRCVEVRAERKRRDRDMLQSMVAIADTGEQLELWEVVQQSQANPTLRRNELMTRLAGFEEVAKAEGHVAEFITLTTPSAFHRKLSNGSDNPKWEGFTPRQGQQWLSKMWARARAKLRRISVLFYGFRVAEPHHDGTPHWHMVLFVSGHACEQLRAVLRGVWLSEYAHEPGAAVHRSAFKQIDPAKGSAAGYLAKYVAKNIDGHRVGADHETQGQDAAESVDRVGAWASAHGIRQFQQIGGPAVTVWRELRRLRDPIGDNAPVEAARKAADDGSWSEFIAVGGGIAVGRRGSVTLSKAHSGELGGYGELKAIEIVGVQSACGSVRTRNKVWRIQRKGQGGKHQTVNLASSLGVRRPAPPCEYTQGALSVLKPSTCNASRQREAHGTEETGNDRPGAPIYSAGQGAQREQSQRGSQTGAAVDLAGSRPAPLSYLGPVSTTVRGAESRNRGEGAGWPPWTQ